MQQAEIIKLLLDHFEHPAQLNAFLTCYVWPAFKTREFNRQEAEREAKRQTKAAAKLPPPVEPHPRYTHIDGSPIPISGPGWLGDLARKRIPVIQLATGHILMPKLYKKNSVTFEEYSNPAADAALEAHIQKSKNQT